MKVGRPTLYTKELAELICERVATSTIGLARLCATYDDLPEKITINSWRKRYPEFSSQYAQSKLFQADLLAEECLEIADDDSFDTRVDAVSGNEVCNTEFIARSRLRIDTRKWLAAKLLPKQYGQMVEENNHNDKSIVVTIVDRLSE